MTGDVTVSIVDKIPVEKVRMLLGNDIAGGQVNIYLFILFNPLGQGKFQWTYMYTYVTHGHIKLDSPSEDTLCYKELVKRRRRVSSSDHGLTKLSWNKSVCIVSTITLEPCLYL